MVLLDPSATDVRKQPSDVCGSGPTAQERRRPPSGLRSQGSSASDDVVGARSVPVRRSLSQTWRRPVRLDAKARYRPSAEGTGNVSIAALEVTRCSSPAGRPDRGSRAILQTLVFSARLANATRGPTA